MKNNKLVFVFSFIIATLLLTPVIVITFFPDFLPKKIREEVKSDEAQIEETEMITETVNISYETSEGFISDTFEKGASLEIIPTPEKEGYSFVKWNTDITTLDADTKLEAVWEKDGFFVTFDASPGTFDDGENSKTLFFDYDKKVSEPSFKVVYENHEFENWKINDTKVFELKKYFSKNASDLTVKAEFKKTKSYVIYNSNTEDNTQEKLFVLPGNDVTIENCSFQNPRKLFSGWNTKKDGSGKTYLSQDIITVEEKDVELFAQWKTSNSDTIKITNITVNDDVCRIDYTSGVSCDDNIYRVYLVDDSLKNNDEDEDEKGEEKDDNTNEEAYSLVAQAYASDEGSIIFTGENLVKQKFVIRAIIDGKETDICEEDYLLQVFNETAGLTDLSRHSIKGILPDPIKMKSAEFDELGIKQVAYNLFLSHFIGKEGERIYFTHNNKEYSLNASMVYAYDDLIRFFQSKNLVVTMILLNDDKYSNPLIHDKGNDPSADFFMFSTTKEDLEFEEALGAFFASRYPYIQNWIIGNEVDAYHPWNYMACSNINEYVDEYSKGFRAFYNGLTGANPDTKVFVSVTQNWSVASARRQFPARDFLDLFAEDNRDIYWHLAHHPYNAPLLDSTAWNSNSTTMNVDTKAITMENIGVLTEYMKTKNFANPDGSRKSIILSEFGYSSSGGNERNQAASIVCAYLQALGNPSIDAFIYTREKDSEIESSQGLCTGIRSLDDTKKLGWSWYAAMGTNRQQEIVNEASKIFN